MIRRILWLAPVVLLAAHAFLGLGPGDYRKGYEKAMHDLERMRQEVGVASEVGEGFWNQVQDLAADEEMPDKWRNGYRQALKDHLGDATLQR